MSSPKCQTNANTTTTNVSTVMRYMCYKCETVYDLREELTEHSKTCTVSTEPIKGTRKSEHDYFRRIDNNKLMVRVYHKSHDVTTSCSDKELFILKILSYGNDAILKYIKCVYFNYEYPDEHKLYLKSLDSQTIDIFRNTTTIISDTKSFMIDLITTTFDILMKHQMNLRRKDILVESFVIFCMNFIEWTDEDIYTSRLYKEVLQMIYDNRQIPLITMKFRLKYAKERAKYLKDLIKAENRQVVKNNIENELMNKITEMVNNDFNKLEGSIDESDRVKIISKITKIIKEKFERDALIKNRHLKDGMMDDNDDNSFDENVLLKRVLKRKGLDKVTEKKSKKKVAKKKSKKKVAKKKSSDEVLKKKSKKKVAKKKSSDEVLKKKSKKKVVKKKSSDEVLKKKSKKKVAKKKLSDEVLKKKSKKKVVKKKSSDKVPEKKSKKTVAKKKSSDKVPEKKSSDKVPEKKSKKKSKKVAKKNLLPK